MGVNNKSRKTAGVQLPAWLSPLWGGVALSMLTFVASLPLLRSSLVRNDDSSFHLYRLLELHHLLSQGVLFSRWLPDLAQGYGFPLFNFYPPLAYYVAEIPHLLGFSLTQSLHLTYILSSILGAVSMYLLVRERSSGTGAVLSALLYAYAPPLLHNTIYRGGMAEVLAWGLAPLILWCFLRLTLTGRVRWLLAASLAYAALLLTHYLSALPLTPLLVLFVLAARPPGGARRGLLPVLVALLLGGGISAFVTLPALLEKGFVHIEMVFLPPGLDFHNHFVSWQELLAGPRAVDVSVNARRFPHAIGLIQAGAGLAGLLVGLLARRAARERTLYLVAAAAAAALVFMTQRASLALWEGLGFLKFIQFPWRLLAPLSLVLAWLAGGIGLLLPEEPGPAGAARSGRRWARLGPALAALVALGLFLYNTPLLYPRYERERPAEPTLSDMLVEERETTLLGTTTMGDYLPIWAGEMPWQSPMPAQYAAGGPISWLDRPSLPAGVRVERERYGVNDIDLAFDAGHPFRVQINQYYFPGWRAEIDGRPAPIIPQERTGLITVDMPAGAHTLRVRFGETPLRLASDALSLLSLAGLIGVAWWGRRTGWPAKDSRPTEGAQAAFPAWGWLCLLAVMAAYLGLKTWVIDRTDNPLRLASLQGDRVRGAQPAQAVFGGKLRLLGYNLQAREVPAGAPASLVLYWRAEHALDTDYSTSVQMVDRDGRVWAEQSNWQPSDLPTSSWDLDEYRGDIHTFTVPPGTPPGGYTLRIAVYHAPTQQVLNPDSGEGQRFALPEAALTVARPAQPPDPASLGLERILAHRLNDDLELLGAVVAPGPRLPGSRVHLDLYWRALRRPAADYSVRAFLIGPGSKALERDLGPLAAAGYPVTTWQAGEVIRAQYDLLLPAEAAAGVNVLQIGLSGPGEPVAIGEVMVEALQRRMDVPPLQQPVGAVFAEGIVLLGYDLDAPSVDPGATVQLRLYWQAQQSIEQEYTVFTHLLDAGGQLVAQQDSQPVQGKRPTTGWLPGEVISDEYTLTVPLDAGPGAYQINVGLYEPASGRRLTVNDAGGAPAGDHLTLGTVTVR